jgi:hypothetical protein
VWTLLPILALPMMNSQGPTQNDHSAQRELSMSFSWQVAGWFMAVIPMVSIGVNLPPKLL